MFRIIRLSLLSPLLFFLLSCTPARSSTASPITSTFFIYRQNPSALLELSSDHTLVQTIPILIPAECALSNLYSSINSNYLALELSCPFGQTVLWLNTRTGDLKQAYTDADSHYLAWTTDGQAIYLKVDSLVQPRILRTSPDGVKVSIPISANTYDLAPQPGSPDFLFSFSDSLGLGSEMWLAKLDGAQTGQVLVDSKNYLSFARWSPDARQIAFIKIPDSSIPFSLGELWIMNSDGSDPHKLASADAGHGFAPAWSPDGKQIAYVERENPDDPLADQSADALVSNIYILDAIGGSVRKLTTFDHARVEAPVWSPDGNNIAFSVFLNDKMNVYFANSISGATQLVVNESTCCPVWVGK